MIRVILIGLLGFNSCAGPDIQSKIEDADRIEVIDDQTRFSHIDTTNQIVEGFKDLFKTKPELTDCPIQGRVLFKKGNTVLLNAGFYKDASACNYLIIEKGDKKEGYRLSFNALAYLGVYFQELKQKHAAENH